MRRPSVRPYGPHGLQAPVGGSGRVEIEEGLVAAFQRAVGILAAQVAAVAGGGGHGGFLIFDF